MSALGATDYFGLESAVNGINCISSSTTSRSSEAKAMDGDGDAVETTIYDIDATYTSTYEIENTKTLVLPAMGDTLPDGIYLVTGWSVSWSNTAVCQVTVTGETHVATSTYDEYTGSLTITGGKGVPNGITGVVTTFDTGNPISASLTGSVQVVKTLDNAGLLSDKEVYGGRIDGSVTMVLSSGDPTLTLDANFTTLQQDSSDTSNSDYGSKTFNFFQELTGV